jgi:hypothetical protein
MTIKEVYLRGEMSNSLYNSCVYSRIYTINELVNKFKEQKDFEKADFCGKKARLELINICEKYAENFSIDQYAEKYLELDTIREKIINQTILFLIQDLNPKSLESLLIFLVNDTSIVNFNKKIFFIKNFKTTKIKCSYKNRNEIDVLLQKISIINTELNSIPQKDKLLFYEYELFLKNELKTESINRSVVIKQSVFSLIQYMLDNELNFDKKEIFILKNAIKTYKTIAINSELFFDSNNMLDQTIQPSYKSGVLEIDEFCKTLNCSIKNYETIRNNVLDILKERLFFLKNYSKDLFKPYNIDFDKLFICVDDGITNTINKNDETNFSKHFITFIISIFHNEKFDLLGEIKDVLIENKIKTKKSYHWNNIYLIDNSLTTNFNFAEFIEDFNKRISELNKQSYTLNFDIYLLDFIKNKEFQISETLRLICKKLIEEEFKIIFYNDINLEFKNNITKKNHR